jgi:hypothetical protein
VQVDTVDESEQMGKRRAENMYKHLYKCAWPPRIALHFLVLTSQTRAVTRRRKAVFPGGGE